jgi:predicted metal-dependent hydrolase
VSSEPSERPITIRRPVFEFPAGLDPVIVDGHPEESFTNVGMSLLLPYLEPYLIRTMQAAKARLDDAGLLRDLAAFNGQEGQHYRQHMRFNEAVRLTARERIAALEAELDADYRRYSESRSLAWNLAYAEGFEAYTGAIALFSFETGLVERMTPSARALFEWHLLEELEHRTVAFDVYDRLFGGYLRRLAVGLFAQWHLNRFVLRVARALETADREAHRARFGGALAKWRRVRPLLWLMVKKLLPKVLRTFTPWYTPHRIALPAGAHERLARYAERGRVAEPDPRPSEA